MERQRPRSGVIALDGLCAFAAFVAPHSFISLRESDGRCRMVSLLPEIAENREVSGHADHGNGEVAAQPKQDCKHSRVDVGRASAPQIASSASAREIEAKAIASVRGSRASLNDRASPKQHKGERGSYRKGRLTATPLSSVALPICENDPYDVLFGLEIPARGSLAEL